MANRTWTAEVFVDSNVGEITATVQASCFTGARQQIERIYGPVQQIVNLREINPNRPTSDTQTSFGGLVLAGIGIVVVGLFGSLGSDTEPSAAPQSAPQPAPIERSYTVPATVDPGASRPLTYANPPGPCVTENFEPC